MQVFPETFSVSHYEIVRKLGEGGMGVVYQARDTELGRYVALKFLPPSLAGSSERTARFRQEARAISALNHAHIATIYGIEDTGEHNFLVLEYLPGGTLRQKLLLHKASGAPVAVRQCLDWAIQIAEGLWHAHKHGIVHRDIKSSNILFTQDALIKIADFGLAKVSGGTGEDVETLTGQAVGTPVYMSPEQARGKDVDSRSDIFSLGILLFELIAGEVPFHSTDTPVVLHDIAFTPAPPLRVYRDDVPDALQSVIDRMLAKNPEERYQTAGELLADLRSVDAQLDSTSGSLLETRTLASPSRNSRFRSPWLAGLIVAACAIGGATFAVLQKPPVPHEKRVAVLLFTNIGGDPSNQALCEGLSEVVSNSLTGLEQFHGSVVVVPASDVRKEGVASARDAGRLLAANLALTGSVQHLDSRHVQVMIGLSDTRTVTQLRTASIVADLPDLTAVQEQVVQKVAAILELALQPQAAQSLNASNTPVPAAYPFYVEGLGYLRRYDQPDNIGRAVVSLQRAIASDPRYALAHIGLAQALWRRYEVQKDTPSIDAAYEEASRGLTLDGRSVQGHITMGMVESAKGEYKRAQSEFQAALKLDPVSADAYRELGTAYSAMGETRQAEATYKQAIQLRRDDWWSVKQLGVFYFFNGRLQEAERCFQEVTRLTPDSAKAYSNLGGLYFKMRRYPDAIAALRKSVSLAPTGDAYANLGVFYYYDHQYPEAAAQFQKAIEMAPERSDYWGNLGDAYRWTPALASKAPDTYRHAIDLIRRQIAVNPRDARLHSQLAAWCAAIGDRRQADAEIAAGLKLAPADGDVQFDAALVYEQAAQRKRALGAAKASLAAGYSPDEFRDSPPLKALIQDPRYLRLIPSTPH